MLAKLRDDYGRAYYAGLIAERQAKALLKHPSPGAALDAYELLREAMVHYEIAESLRPTGNDDALLRWNACARIIMANRLVPRSEGSIEPALE